MPDHLVHCCCAGHTVGSVLLHASPDHPPVGGFRLGLYSRHQQCAVHCKQPHEIHVDIGCAHTTMSSVCCRCAHVLLLLPSTGEPRDSTCRPVDDWWALDCAVLPPLLLPLRLAGPPSAPAGAARGTTTELIHLCVPSLLCLPCPALQAALAAPLSWLSSTRTGPGPSTPTSLSERRSLAGTSTTILSTLTRCVCLRAGVPEKHLALILILWGP